MGGDGWWGFFFFWYLCFYEVWGCIGLRFGCAGWVVGDGVVYFLVLCECIRNVAEGEKVVSKVVVGGKVVGSV